ncbi:MAG: hypothetical protein APF81_03480 [Desulfosporosinus sp. BRH_c37]|nr:MAG: hypothetical protein APF81_03480 [Desulfosporosinus sp. BRH_c37]
MSKEKDFEKYVTGAMFVLTTVAIVINFLKGSPTEMSNYSLSNMTYFSMGLGGLFVTRKAVSYFKPPQYYSQGEVKKSEKGASEQAATKED